jgi:hypothetical protein
MSRHIINDGMGALCGSMDVMTIDASRLQIPASGVRGKSRGRVCETRMASGLEHMQNRDLPCEPRCDSQQEQVTPMLGCVGAAGGKREDIVIDVRPRGDARGDARLSGEVQGLQALLETPAIAVPMGYLGFWLALALCNLLHPRLTHAVCIALSPLPMLCILAHAVGIHPVWIGWGLTLCAWLPPSVCALWSVPYSAGYLVCLVALAVAGCRRPAPALCLAVIIACAPLSLNPQWTGLEPKIWMTVLGFFAAMACATAYVGGGKIVCRIKSGQ